VKNEFQLSVSSAQFLAFGSRLSGVHSSDSDVDFADRFSRGNEAALKPSCLQHVNILLVRASGST